MKDIKFVPEFFLQDRPGTLVIHFFAELDPEVLTMATGVVELTKTGQVVSCSLRVVDAVIEIVIKQGDDAQVLASIQLSVDLMPIEKLASILGYQVQKAFFIARKSLSQPLALAPLSAGAGFTPTGVVPGFQPFSGKFSFKRFATKRWLVGGVVTLGLALVVFGAVRPKPADAPIDIQAALQSGDVAGLQKAIQDQVNLAGATAKPSAFSLNQGSNVALETMRQMGLDPGKANAGCLVGVK